MNNIINWIKKTHTILFYSLYCPFLFMKAWGMEDGNKMYVSWMYISIVLFFVLIICKDYSQREKVKIGIILIISVTVWYYSGVKGTILTAIVLILTKDINIDRVLKVSFWIWVCSIGVKEFLVIIGIIPENSEGYRIKRIGEVRHDGGYSHPNFLCAIIVIAFLYMAYAYWNWLKKWCLILVVMVMMVVYFLTYSYTGTLISIIMCALCSIYFFINRKVDNIYIFNKFLTVACAIPISLTFIFQLVYVEGSSFANFIDLLTTCRVLHGHEMLRAYDITLFGQMFDGRLKYEVVDNAYIFILLRMGMAYFVMFVAGYVKLIYKAYKQNDTAKLLVVFAFMLYGFMEKFIRNPFMNFSLLFVAETIWDTNYNIDTENKEI